MNYFKKEFGLILNSLSVTFQAVKKQKKIFFSLIVLQLLLLTIFTVISVNYPLKIAIDAKEIINQLETVDYEVETAEDAEPVMQNIMEVYNNYQSMIKNLGYYCLWLCGLFLGMNGLLWILTQRLLKEQEKYSSYLHQWLKYVVSIFVFTLPFLLVFYYLFKIIIQKDLGLETFTGIAKIAIYSFAVILGVIYYLLLSLFAFIDLKSWKAYVQKLWKIAIFKIHLIAPLLLINLILIAGCSALIYYFVNLQILTLMILATILLGIIFVFTRIFWTACLKEISKE